MKTVKFALSISVMLVFLCSNPAIGQWATSGTNIYNTNSGYVGVGNSAPATLLYVAKNMTEPTITVRNLGGIGGATYQMYDNASGADWKFKATSSGGFKIRDHAYAMDVFTIEANSSPNSLYINAAGNVGIGTNTPSNKLHVNGDFEINTSYPFIYLNATGSADNNGINWESNGEDKAWFYFSDATDNLIMSNSPSGTRSDFLIKSDGRVCFGTTVAATGYKVSVAGKVMCEEVRVEAQASWPDYVFADDYQLMSLQEMEQHIRVARHLPGIPSAAEIGENGFELADMQKRVVEKLEELTLHTIEQGKQIDELQKMVADLKKENSRLKSGKQR